ncbi:hypothetical protein PR202_gb08934 [Eleusine coracana subsp. coracana]|uniref:non-specific serine/threonine protein kinase n=1 Tax=Eleusine coracana subsp. coracana TaxID=191504 RepID=A0AAV5EGG7_ELECO|nr:hypothetical protein PR202_gb08934 [Eleusine coracana subsp. coracana]
MWRFNPFGGKVQNGLEGHTIDVGNLKITVRNIIAEGGFSCVYLASDALHVSKQYALKHIICNDSESLDLVMKEIKMMDLLKGHPNVVTLVAHDVFDMGRTKEALLVMEFCEKSLVSAMERRGSGYYEEKKALLIFRDVCNAVFAMHGQSPPIAHRDLKAENVLLGFDGAWKICDFGSTSTNHKCFDRPEEMGIEEDIIRRHTTPAYRAPEMWDLYRKEVISEKVDIWVWFHVNELLPLELQKNLPDGASSTISMVPQDEGPYLSLDRPSAQGGVWGRIIRGKPYPCNVQCEEAMYLLAQVGAYKRTPVMPRRNPPPPSKERSISSSHGTSKAGDAPLGAFWATQHAQSSHSADNKNHFSDEGPIKPLPSSKHGQSKVDISTGTPGDRRGQAVWKSTPNNSICNNGMESQSSLKTKTPQPHTKTNSVKDPFNSFVADFDSNNLHAGTSVAGKASDLELELSSLKEQLKKTTLEKDEMTAKYEKLSAICRSQRQEIQELKRTLAESTPPSNKISSRAHGSVSQRKEKMEGTVWELEQGMLATNFSAPSSEAMAWQAFPEPKAQARPKNITIVNVSGNRCCTGQQA